MSIQEQVLELIEKKDGLLLTREAEEAGIPRQYLTRLVREGLIERVSHGVYVTPDTFEDELYILQARNRHIIFSHATALYFHNSTDRDPIAWSVTIPPGFNGTYLIEKGLQVFSIKKPLHSMGVIQGKTSFGRPIRLYNPERALCDVIRNRSAMDPALLNDSMKRYLSGSDKNIPLLMRYSKEMRIANSVRKYVEILL